MPSFKYRILFVDDEYSVRETGAAVLQSAGYEVLTAEDGLDALKCLDCALPELVITDLRMPRMSGFELLAVIRTRFPQIPTIALSGEYVTGSLPDGLLADAYLQKGQYEIPDFFNTIRELLSKLPVRPFPGTRNTSPIWVALHGAREVVITCPKCLRSFETDPTQLHVGMHQAVCAYCQNTFAYNIDQHSKETMLGSKPALDLKRGRSQSS